MTALAPASLQTRRYPDLARMMLLPVVAALSITAAVVHFYVAPQHFEEWWGFGTFFVVAGALQLLFPLCFWPSRTRQPVALAGIAGNLAIVATYVYSRMTTLPVGPADAHGGHGAPETVGALDFVTTLTELTLIVVLVATLRGRIRGWTVNVLAAAGILGLLARYLLSLD